MGSLLETILASETLKQQLEQIPADQHTRTFELPPSPLTAGQWPTSNPPTEPADLRPSDHAMVSVDATSGKLAGKLSPAGTNITVDADLVENARQASHQHDQTESDERPAMSDEGFVPRRRIVSVKDSRPANEDTEYRLIGELGSGGTAIVYQAHQRAIDREVAIKVLRDEHAGDAHHRARFLAEARVIGAMDHPNVIALHDLCLDETGHPFYSMKRIDGASWDEQIDELETSRNIDILLRVADAVRYAHSRGLIHRDLKPENVMLGTFGEVLVADWGLAFAVESSLATTSAVGGTPAYMAPEMATKSWGPISFATDVYLLGAILFRILTGQPPHHGDNLLACLQAAAVNDIVPSQVEGQWMDVAMRAMRSKPSDRFATVDEFIAAIASQRDHEESTRLTRRARRHLEPSESPPETASETSHDADTVSDTNPYRRHRIAEALLREAIEIWPDNTEAIKYLAQTQTEFARIAASRGDYDLSLLLYDNAGQGDSEAAARVRRKRDDREDLNQDHAKYSALFTQSPDAGLLIRWANGELVEANAAFAKLVGYGNDELVGLSMSSLTIWVCPDRRGVFLEMLGRDGRVDNFETQFRTKSADLIDVLISSRRVEVGDEEMVMSTIRDISPRKAAERELQQSRRRLRDLQQLAGLGTWSYNVIEKRVVWSDESFRIAGRQPERGEPGYEEFMQLIHPDDRVMVAGAIANAIQSVASYEFVMRMRDDSGDYRRLLTRGQPVRDEDGRVMEVYGVMMRAELTP
ncbi:MAG: protein kinase [Planctomycetota bacterium]